MSLTITEATRPAARKLLRQWRPDLPSAIVYAMSYAQLSDALRLAAAGAPTAAEQEARSALLTQTLAARPEPASDPVRETVRETVRPAPVATPTAGSLEAIFGAMIDARIAALPPAGVSADDVRAMLEEVLAGGVLPPSTIKVDAMGTVREVTGARHYLFETVLQFIASGCHVWLPGPAGSGKSMLARQCFEALGYHEPGRGGIHMTGAIETPFQLLGYVSPNGDDRTLYTPFRKAWENGGAFIFDDVDRSNAKALAAFNEALANGYCAFPDAVIKAHPDLRIVATANTYGTGGGAEYVGASRMDGATLTRFAKLTVPYDERLEAELAGREYAEWCRYVQSVRAAVDRLAIKHLVTPRATLLGVRLMLAGVKRETVEDATLWAGLDAATVARIKGAL